MRCAERLQPSSRVVPARAGVEVEPPARGGGGVDEPLEGARSPERAVEIAVHGPRRLRAGPVLHPRVEPPGAPPVEGDAREPQPLVRRALHRLERPGACALGERRRIGDDEPQPPAPPSHEIRSVPRGPRATQGAQGLRRRAPRPDWRGRRATPSWRGVSRTARDVGVGRLHQRLEPREPPRPVPGVKTAKRRAARRAQRSFTRDGDSGSHCLRRGTPGAPSRGGRRPDAGRGRGGGHRR